MIIWLYNPNGRRFITDVITLERSLLGAQHNLDERLRAVQEFERWLTRTSWSRWVERYLTAVQVEGIIAFLYIRLKDKWSRQREREARKVNDKRKLVDRYLNPSARYYTIDEAEQLFSIGGVILTDILEFKSVKWPLIIEQSTLRAQLEDRATRWRVLEVLRRPRGLTYVLRKDTDS